MLSTTIAVIAILAVILLSVMYRTVKNQIESTVEYYSKALKNAEDEIKDLKERIKLKSSALTDAFTLVEKAQKAEFEAKQETEFFAKEVSALKAKLQEVESKKRGRPKKEDGQL